MYQRQFALMASVVLLSFALLGSAFIALSYRYTVEEKQSTLATNAEYISTYTGYMKQLEPNVLASSDFQRNISAMATVANLSIVLAETDCRVVFASDGVTGSTLYGDSGVRLPAAVTSAIANGASFSGMLTISGLGGDSRYGVGYPITWTQNGQTGVGGIVLVSSDASSLTQMWRALAQIFFLLLLSYSSGFYRQLHYHRPSVQASP